jgi:tryptophanase
MTLGDEAYTRNDGYQALHEAMEIQINDKMSTLRTLLRDGETCHQM